MVSPVGKNIHLKTNECNALQKCLPASPFEAFRPGAAVERKYYNGDLYQGRIEDVLLNFMMAIVRCGDDDDDHILRRTYFYNLTLVKPAPKVD